MNTHMIIEMVGYAGSLIVLISFLMSSVVKLRIINAVGGSIFSAYALIIQSYPTAFMNLCLVCINIYYLLRLKKSEKDYDLVEGNSDDSMLSYLLKHYREDILKYFPKVKMENLDYDTVYIVCCDGVPAGILMGNRNSQGELRAELDYSTPAYRDCSVGEYLYSRLPAKGIKKILVSGESQKHEGYLKTMGFEQQKNEYVKELG